MLDYMPADQPFSIRMQPATRERLEELGRRRGESKARVAERLLDEGLRMEAHPGIVFRDGPAGRRAALLAGPDVWEVMETVAQSERRGEAAIATAAEWGNLGAGDVRVAVAYYADHRDEIDAWIEANRREARRVREAHERARDVLA